MIEAFVVLLIGSVLIAILNKMPEKEVKVEKHKKTISKFFKSFHNDEANNKRKAFEKHLTKKESLKDIPEKDNDVSKKEKLIALADKYLEEKKIGEAEEKYIEVLKIDEHDPSSYKGLGNICFIKKNYTDAEDIFDKLTKINPNDSSSYCNLGMCCYKKNDFKRAKENYKKALTIEGKTTYYKNLAITLIKLKEYNDALDNLLAVIQKDTKDKESFRLAVSILEDIKDIKKQKKVARILLKNEPKNPILIRISKK